ncbi:hypothetical protein [Bacillus sp. ISL-18]|nr:hypothetical protein [Bacillus sp. ISL-18]
MKTCQRCDGPLKTKSKYCEECQAENDREKDRAKEQKERRTRKRD